MATALPLQVQPPTPLPARFGLFSALTLATPPTPYWSGGGLEWEDYCGAVEGIGPVTCDPATPTIGLPKKLDAAAGLSQSTAKPFTLYSPFRCSLVGSSMEDAQQKATGALLRLEEAAVERELWTGELTGEGFAKGAEVLQASGDVKVCIARLEQWVSDTFTGNGVIHVTRGAALVLLASGVLETSGTALRTKLGTPVVAGVGYLGTAPDGSAAGDAHSWAYATGALVGVRGDVFTSSEGMAYGLPDLPRNDRYAIAERFYAVGTTRACDDSTPSSAGINLNLEG